MTHPVGHEPPLVPTSAIAWSHSPDLGEVLKGVMKIAGLHMHVWAVRVEDDEDDMLQPVDDPWGFFDDLLRLEAAAYHTTELPGYEGQWVVWAAPFQH